MERNLKANNSDDWKPITPVLKKLPKRAVYMEQTAQYHNAVALSASLLTETIDFYFFYVRPSNLA